MTDNKRVAVVVGYHSFVVPAFQEMLESFPGLHCYPQHLEQFTSSSREIRDGYDAVVFYTMEHRTPSAERPWYEGDVLDAMEHLGECGQGITVLHHNLLAFEKWPVWKELCGLDPALYHDYRLDVPMRFQIQDREHFITQGLEDFEMTDEAYLCDPIRAASGMKILLSSVYEGQENAAAWTKNYKNARVFCLQPGHGPEAYGNRNFRTLLYRGILWSMGIEKAGNL